MKAEVDEACADMVKMGDNFCRRQGVGALHIWKMTTK